LNETQGSATSSIRYRRNREGNARNRRVTVGTIVQIVSTSWASKVYRETSVFIIRDNRAHPTIDKTTIKTRIAWSWNARR
jgi:hypothetical protein